MRTKCFITIILSLTITPAFSQEVQLLKSGNRVGSGVFTYFFWNIYEASLYALNGKYVEDGPLALKLTYLREFEGEKIAERSLREMEVVGCIEEGRGSKWLSEMKKIFPNVKSGDSLIGVRDDDGQASFYKDSKLLGKVADVKFSKCFFDIWLSSNTSEPALRSKLLGI